MKRGVLLILLWCAAAPDAFSKPLPDVDILLEIKPKDNNSYCRDLTSSQSICYTQLDPAEAEAMLGGAIAVRNFSNPWVEFLLGAATIRVLFQPDELEAHFPLPAPLKEIERKRWLIQDDLLLRFVVQALPASWSRQIVPLILQRSNQTGFGRALPLSSLQTRSASGQPGDQDPKKPKRNMKDVLDEAYQRLGKVHHRVTSIRRGSLDASIRKDILTRISRLESRTIKTNAQAEKLLRYVEKFEKEVDVLLRKYGV